MMAAEGTLSSDGSCKSFDSGANGFARAEGITAIYIKRLSDAIRDGNPIRSIIRASGSNSDGSRAGLMQPQARTQEALIRQVYKRARLDPGDTAFVECHGTGTATGDPIETRAIDNVFGEHGVYIGSVKPNIGHTEGSAGLASLIKAVLALENAIIPPNIKFQVRNPKMPGADRLLIPVAPTPFPPRKQHRISVNSFGIGGSNSHVILDSYAPATNGMPNATKTNPASFRDTELPSLMPFSAYTEHSLRRQIELYTAHIRQNPTQVHDIAYTRSMRRENLPHRAFAIVESKGRTLKISNLLKTSNQPWGPKVVMVFSGQGSQWAGMGRELLFSSSDFRADISAMDTVLKVLPKPPHWSLSEVLSDHADIEKFNSAELSQPLCTALQIAIVHHLRRVGVLPAIVVGHSSGEIAAAYAAGHISLQMAIRAAFYRGLVTREADRKGAMAAVSLGSQETSRYLAEGVVIACENSPSSSTISGDRALIEQSLASIRKDRPNVFTRLLKVDMAYHSSHMAILGDMYLHHLEAERPSCNDTFFDQGAIFISSVTGSQASAQDVSSPNYWVRNLVQRVRFSTAIQMAQTIISDHVLLEVGPHATLGGPLRQIGQPQGAFKYVATQKRGEDCDQAMLEAFGQLYQYGVPVDFRPLFQKGKTLPGLPTYPWDHTGPSFWYENRISRASRLRQYPRHCLLGLKTLDSSDSQPVWRNIMDLDDLPWLTDHKVGGNIVFPFAGYVSLASEAIRQVKRLSLTSGLSLRYVVAKKALVLKQSQSVEIITSLRPGRLTDTTNSDWFHFQIQSHDGENWTEHCVGEITTVFTPHIERANDFHVLPRQVSKQTFYSAMSRTGLSYGPEFALLQDITASATDHVAQAHIVDTGNHSNNAFILHPAELDSCLQLVFVAASQGLCRNINRLYVPTMVENLEIYGPRSDFMNVQSTWNKKDHGSCQIDCVGSSGESIFSLKGVQLAPLEDSTELNQVSHRHGLARLEWFPAFDFSEALQMLQPPPLNREHLAIEHQLTLLCIMEELEKVRNITASNAHLSKLQEWMSDEMSKALETGTFPLIRDTKWLTELDETARRCLIDEHVTFLSTGPHAPFAQACKRVCEHGPSIFSGVTDTIDVLTRDNLLTEVYNVNSYNYGQFVSSFSKSRPNLRILEVGAGTGGTTELVLRELVGDATDMPSFSLYTFTDVSAGFFAKAKERFSHVPNMEYRTLDASKPPLEQGFENAQNSYDLVIAANVIHATPFIGETLANVRSLLKNDGILLLTEPLPTLKTVSYIFGHFSGWWLGEADGRFGGPLVGIERWDRELKSSGFSGAETVSFGAEEPYRQIMTIVARAESAQATINGRSRGNVTLLCEKATSNIAVALKTQLNDRGWNVDTHELSKGPPTPSQVSISCVNLEEASLNGKLYDQSKFELLREVMNSLAEKTLWLMPTVQTEASENYHAAQFLGFSRSLRSELGLQIYTLEISEIDSLTQPQLVMDVFEKILEEVDAGALAPDMEYASRDSQILISRFRHVTLEDEIRRLSSESTAHGDSAELRIGKKGFMNTLYWQRKELMPYVPDGHVEVEIRAVGLNAFDIFTGKGIIHSHIETEDLRFGCEAAGIIRRIGSGVTGFQSGDRVMLFSDGGSFATHAVIPADLALKIPDSMAYEQAATIPVCFGTVLYSLIHVARIEKGQTVLIHSACGGVGLAAIQVCQMLGAEIFLTVGSKKKVQYLMENFAVPPERIFHSRDATFVSGIMRETHDAGVDVVLNSLTGELLHESWKCVAEFGCMIDLSRRDADGLGQLNMMPFGHNRSYHGVEAIQFTRRPALFRRFCHEFLRHAEQGTLRPIQPLTVVAAHLIERAFRTLDDSAHIGKIAVTMTPETTLSAAPYVRCIKFDPKGTYLLTGGVGGLGRAISTWMVDRGARHLTFLSRSSGISESSNMLFKELELMGCSVVSVAGSADKEEDVEVAMAQSTLPIKGVLHLAMVLRDISLMDMTWSQWREVISPKVTGAWNLHASLLQHKQTPDFFFLASSIISVLDASGQANYVAANAVNDAFCKFRHSLGLPACVLNICPIIDAGFVSENESAAQSLQAQGLHGVHESEFLDCLELILLQGQKPAGEAMEGISSASRSNQHQIVMGLHVGQDLDNSRSIWRRDRRMGTYHNMPKQASTAANNKQDALRSFLASLDKSNAAEQLRNKATIQFFATEIGKKIFEYRLRPDEEVDTKSTVARMGLDSLLSVELARWFKSAFGVRMGVLEIVGGGTLEQLATMTAGKICKQYTQTV
ncbi:hypothetical protein PFICI_01588 [Pestalotiopsis fici W106-1]|uniref:Uncharacterized protein n=1 Tax=Pestalotiopsis fici (strain W106-1 / CGMCC3.15140) TaxID=1229662 RepID=W3XP83_PESFW|nr:uncharacterized protein PFICI_01588 [Pestalotiopsis fici W106-1]ETS87760.1 hypothetical protein PFICI_01588 [Pestalotiopsis fici W106-1]